MMMVYGKDSWETFRVYDIKRDVHGYPHFLIHRNGQWIYRSAKHFQPSPPDRAPTEEEEMMY